MRYIIIVVLFVICLVIGFTFFSKYDKRKKFFTSLIMLAEKLTVEINFSRERLKVLIENFDKNTKQNLLGIDEGFISYLDKRVELNEKEIFKKADVLKKDEKDFILLFQKGELLLPDAVCADKAQNIFAPQTRDRPSQSHQQPITYAR